MCRPRLATVKGMETNPTKNNNRQIAQIISRTGAIKGDKFANTHGWYLDTRNGKSILRYNNRHQTNEQCDYTIASISTALQAKGYAVHFINACTLSITKETN
jgi:hypothetical protein